MTSVRGGHPVEAFNQRVSGGPQQPLLHHRRHPKRNDTHSSGIASIGYRFGSFEAMRTCSMLFLVVTLVPIAAAAAAESSSKIEDASPAPDPGVLPNDTNIAGGQNYCEPLWMAMCQRCMGAGKLSTGDGSCVAVGIDCSCFECVVKRGKTKKHCEAELHHECVCTTAQTTLVTSPSKPSHSYEMLRGASTHVMSLRDLSWPVRRTQTAATPTPPLVPPKCDALWKPMCKHCSNRAVNGCEAALGIDCSCYECVTVMRQPQQQCEHLLQRRCPCYNKLACSDDSLWVSQKWKGKCHTYAAGQINAGFCSDKDNKHVPATSACPVSCGTCPATCVLSKRMANLNKECCDEASERCAKGLPQTCNAKCAVVFNAFWKECHEQLLMHYGHTITRIWSNIQTKCAATEVACASHPCKNEGVCSALGRHRRLQPTRSESSSSDETGTDAGQDRDSASHGRRLQGSDSHDPHAHPTHGFQCVCPPNYYGATCNKHCTAATSCSGHGTCTKAGAVYKCTCLAGYFGPSCQVHCTSATCSGHGTCDQFGACVCDQGHCTLGYCHGYGHGTSTTVPSCTFEIDMCGWTNTGVQAWTRGSSTPTSNTGPSKANDGKIFMFLETSNGNTGDASFLTSPKLHVKAGTSSTSFAGYSFSFYYHMCGQAMGVLYLQVNIKGRWSTLWSKSGQQQSTSGAAWTKVTVKLPIRVFQVRFKGTKGRVLDGDTGDMAIDTVTCAASIMTGTKQQCALCQPGYDPRTTCSTCLQPNYDPSQGCTNCKRGYNLAKGCKECTDAAFDPNRQCDECKLLTTIANSNFTGVRLKLGQRHMVFCNKGYRGGGILTSCTGTEAACKTCKPGLDLAKKCLVCKNPLVDPRSDQIPARKGLTKCPSTCKGSCYRFHNGRCDSQNNNAACDYDGGDCPEMFCTSACLNPHYDPRRGCKQCKQANYDLAKQCSACLRGYDLSTKCTTCLQPNYDPKQGCKTCKPGLDPAKKCVTCKNPLYAPVGLCTTACLNPYYDPRQGCKTCKSGLDPAKNCLVCKNPLYDPAGPPQPTKTGPKGLTKCPSTCKGRCSYFNDGGCDSQNNNAACDYDGGDCHVHGEIFCSTACLNPHYDPSQGCKQCKKGYDPAHQCKTCIDKLYDPAKSCNECLHPHYDNYNNHYTTGYCTYCKKDYDPADQCALCVNKLYDPATGCTDCIFRNYDPRQACTKCQHGYDLAHKCTVCLPGLDPSKNCTVCLQPHYDPSQGCKTCKSGLDLAKKCVTCRNPLYDPAGPPVLGRRGPKGLTKCPSTCKGSCLAFHNGGCDSQNNNAACDYDGGDCPPYNVRRQILCTTACLNPLYDPRQGCNQCKQANYDPAHKCTVCLPGLGPSKKCTVCLQPHYDPIQGCKTCKSGLDLAKKCVTCRNPLYDPAGPPVLVTRGPKGLTKCPSTCQGSWSYFHDGYCNSYNNNAACDYDGGDCPPHNVRRQILCTTACLNPLYDPKQGCKTCKPELDPAKKCVTCKNPLYDPRLVQFPGRKGLTKCPSTCKGRCSYFHDGGCDSQNNNAACDYDGGDCPAKMAISRHCAVCLQSRYSPRQGCKQCKQANYDPAQKCAVCLRGYDLSTNCTTCLQPNYDPKQGCKQCQQANYDPAQTCTACLRGYDLRMKCVTCLQPNYDPKQGCKQCKQKHFNPALQCVVCKPGRDLTTKCTTCLQPNFDPIQGCKTCKKSELDPAKKCVTCKNPLYDPRLVQSPGRKGLTKCPSTCKGRCSYFHDGGCDRQNNNAACDYDGGDCPAKMTISRHCAVCLQSRYSPRQGCKQCKQANYDPAQKCAVCLRGYDLSTNCTTCLQPNYDPRQACTKCKHGYDLAHKCTVCLPGLDPSKNCTVCLQPHYDPIQGCKTCKPGLDPTKKCVTCRNPLYDPAGPPVLGRRGPKGLTKCPSTCKGRCSYFHNGGCDSQNNNAACDYDGGDCPPYNVRRQILCTTACLNPLYDPRQACTKCGKHGYDLAHKCTVCLPGLDPSKNCTVCLQPHYDPSQGCKTCKPGLDLAKKCVTCKNPLYDPAGPPVLVTRGPKGLTKCPSTCKGRCSYFHDGGCDSQNNNAACDYDGGDCPPYNVRRQILCTTACLNPLYDPRQGCNQCKKGYDPARNCATCSDALYDPIKRCIECVSPHFDPQQACRKCKNGYDPAHQCKTCVDKLYDPGKSCTDCLNPHYDNIYSGYTTGFCKRCKANYDAAGIKQANYDPAQKCAVCLRGYDLSTKCTTCLQPNYDPRQACTKCKHGYDLAHKCTVCLPGLDP
eukprot:COSAG01_NODE_543_length_15700_cov_50.208961_1_plen_2259_part_10